MQAFRTLFVCSFFFFSSFLRTSTTTALDTITPNSDAIGKKSKFNKKRQAGIIISSAILVLGILILGFLLYKRKKNLRNQGKPRLMDYRRDYFEEEKEDMELPLFDLTTIANATDDFSSSNKMGEGGFGPVYKGTLVGGKEIAVKRRSKDSGQGMKEFKNEVILIAKLQHQAWTSVFLTMKDKNHSTGLPATTLLKEQLGGFFIFTKTQD
ncbi:hypothetical protein M0R45_014346 [Rubus argutus]|uniref:Protein kinase domain-containing protein n=1 Tax=Rubus argutus TaxID=59490 RepID=A0AAW1XM12_RUBAR